MYEWFDFKSGKYFGLPIGIMQLQKDSMCKKNSIKLDNRIEGPSLNTHTSVDLKSIQEALSTVEQSNKAHMEVSPFQLPLAPPIRKVELPSKMWTSSMDYVLCFKLHFWPACALSWFNEKHDWISDETIRKIKDYGCHLVAKPLNDRTYFQPADEWRISFSVAEKILSEKLTKFEKKCYLVAKMIFYQNFKTLKDHETGRHLPSYVLKTIKFRLQDFISKGQWQQYEVDDNLHAVISLYYQELATHLKSGNLSSYFIEEMNILKGFSEPFLKECTSIADGIAKQPENFVHCWDLGLVYKLKEILDKVSIVPDHARDEETSELIYYDFNLWLGQIRQIHENLLLPPDAHVWLWLLQTVHRSKENLRKVCRISKPDPIAKVEKLLSIDFLRLLFTRDDKPFLDGFCFYYDRFIKEQLSFERKAGITEKESTVDTSFQTKRYCYVQIFKHVLKCYTELKHSQWDMLFHRVSKYNDMTRDYDYKKPKLTLKDLIEVVEKYCAMTIPHPRISSNEEILEWCFENLVQN